MHKPPSSSLPLLARPSHPRLHLCLSPNLRPHLALKSTHQHQHQHQHRRPLTTTPPRPSPARPQARIYDPIRDPDAFSTALLLATSSNTPLITLWTASWCGTCKTVAPLVQRAVVEAAEAVAAEGGGGGGVGAGGKGDGVSVGGSGSGSGSGRGEFNVAYAEVELDSPTIGDVPSRYLITSIPTLLAFRRGEAQMAERLQGGTLLGNEAAVKRWVEEVVRGGGGGGTGLISGLMSWFGAR